VNKTQKVLDQGWAIIFAWGPL